MWYVYMFQYDLKSDSDIRWFDKSMYILKKLVLSCNII